MFILILVKPMLAPLISPFLSQLPAEPAQLPAEPAQLPAEPARLLAEPAPAGSRVYRRPARAPAEPAEDQDPDPADPGEVDL